MLNNNSKYFWTMSFSNTESENTGKDFIYVFTPLCGKRVDLRSEKFSKSQVSFHLASIQSATTMKGLVFLAILVVSVMVSEEKSLSNVFPFRSLFMVRFFF